jgi:integrase/recombinase XerD
MTDATISLLHDNRKRKADGTYPVKLTVYYQLDKKRYATGVDLNEEDWKKINGSKLKDHGLKEVKLRLDAIVLKANKVIKRMEEFSFQEFEDDFFGRKELRAKNSFVMLFKDYIANVKAEGRIGTAATYTTTLNSLLEIKKNYRISDITTAFLKQYEAFHRKKGNSDTTIGINMRNIRAVVNKAIAQKLLPQEKYPFKGYVIPSGQNVKKALEWEAIQKLLKYKPTDDGKKKAFDLWLFSYLCNGMNTTDIAHLKKSDVDTDFLQFKRRKTMRTRKKDQRPIRVALHQKAKEIIAKYQSTDNPYVFGILEPGLSPVTERNRIKRLLKFINQHMKEIADELDIKLGANYELTTYVARHSFATRLKRKGASTDEISEYLGHSSVNTTRNYLDSFEDDLLKKRSRLLTSDE